VKKNILGIAALSLCMFANWGSEETTVEGHKKQSVNFYGVLTTQQGQTYKVENIAIGRRHDQIPLFEMQKNNKMGESVACSNSAQSTSADERLLCTDPKEGIITKIDLSEVAHILIPNPAQVWVYQKRKGSRLVEYIEIIITSNDEQKTENHYFIDTARKMTCDQVNAAGPIEQEVPFKAIKKLVIEGYNNRDAHQKNNGNNNAKKNTKNKSNGTLQEANIDNRDYK
jgi:hypothetical protein